MSDNPVLAALDAFNKAHPHRQVVITEESLEQARRELDEPASVDGDASSLSDVRPPTDTTEAEQLDIATLARDEAIGRVERNADSELVHQYERVARMIARRQAEMTTDDIEEAAERDGLPIPHEKRMLGPLMLRLARGGVLVRTEATVLSSRKSNHRRPIRVWRSLLYVEPRSNWSERGGYD